MSDQLHTHSHKKTIRVRSDALPLACPMPDQTLWNAHPRVYLTVDDQGTAQCPYCGTAFVVSDD